MHCTGMPWYNAPSDWWYDPNTSMLTWDHDPSPSVMMTGNGENEGLAGSITLTPNTEIVFTVKNY